MVLEYLKCHIQLILDEGYFGVSLVKSPVVRVTLILRLRNGEVQLEAISEGDQRVQTSLSGAAAAELQSC